MAGTAKYSIEIANRIAGIVSAGKPTSVACRIEGISRTCFYLWMREHAEFAALMEQAEGKRIESRLEAIERKSATDWRADAWLLERTTEEFREKKDVNLSVQHAFESMLDACRPLVSEGAYREFVDALARLKGVDTAAAALPPDAEG